VRNRLEESRPVAYAPRHQIEGGRPSVNDESLERRLRARSARIAIVGLGYAGLPMAVELAGAGFPVVGLDVDERKVKHITRGHSPVSNVADHEIAPLVTSGKLTASTNENVLDTADVAIVCVPTPLDAAGGPDLRFVQSAGETIAAHIRPDTLVILQSTCGPGTTSRVLAPTLERRSGLRAGEDFYVAFAPERIDPGNQRFTVKNTPKLVGGLTPEATRLACLLYEPCIDEVVPVSSPEVAELAKLVENTFRFINISFVNEMALLCDRLGVNVWEVIEATKTKPFAFMAHYPSPGVGGHCIPVVPQYLDAAAQDVGLASELIPAAYRVNDAMPKLIVDKLERALDRSLLGTRVLLVGITYKPDIADVRESAAVRVLQEATRRGAEVAYHDPHMPILVTDDGTYTSIGVERHELAAMDAVVLLTPHTTIDYDRIVRQSRLVLDTHNGLRPREAPNVINVWTPSAPSVVLSS